MALEKEYENFNDFLDMVLSIVKEKESDLDYWLGAVVSVFGSSMLIRLLHHLGIRASIIGLGLLAAPIVPFFGVASVAEAGLLVAKYKSKGNTKKGKKISENLRVAKYLFEEYISSDLSERKKKALIDDLFDKLVCEKKIAY